MAKKQEKPLENPTHILRGYEPLKGGCSVVFFADLLNVSEQTIRNKLKNCPSTTHDGRTRYYRPDDAIGFLAEPKLDWDEILKKKRPSDLPTPLQNEYWKMRLIRLEVEQKAGELWHVDTIVEALVEIAQAIKFSVQLWPDNINRQVGITAEQRTILMELSDQFQESIVSQIESIMEGNDKTSELHNIMKQTKEYDLKQSDKDEDEIADMLGFAQITNETNEDFIEGVNASEDHWETYLKGFE